MIGQVIENKYRIERLLGSGGFAVVYAARNVLIDRPVALKILHPNLVQTPGVAERFLREAKIACKSIHPTIVRVEDIGQLPGGAPYLVMELIEGWELTKEVEKHGALPFHRFVQIASLMLEGLAKAHERGFIHRDVKPSNIFLVRPGFADPPVRILDLGMAKDLGNADVLTITGDVIGTPNYVAPEVLLSTDDARWAPTVDVFSAGMVCYLMLTGRLPFARDHSSSGYEALRNRMLFYNSNPTLEGPRHFNPDVPDPIDALVRRALALDAKKRYRDAGKMLLALQKATAGPPGDAPSLAFPELPDFDDDDAPTTELSSHDLPTELIPGDDTSFRNDHGLELSAATPESSEESPTESSPPVLNAVGVSTQKLDRAVGEGTGPLDGRHDSETMITPWEFSADEDSPTQVSLPPEAPEKTVVDHGPTYASDADSPWPQSDVAPASPTPSALSSQAPSEEDTEDTTPGTPPLWSAGTINPEAKRSKGRRGLIAATAIVILLITLAGGAAFWMYRSDIFTFAGGLTTSHASSEPTSTQPPRSATPEGPATPTTGEGSPDAGTKTAPTGDASPTSGVGSISADADLPLSADAGFTLDPPSKVVKVELINLPRFAAVTVDGEPLESPWIKGERGSKKRLVVRARGYPTHRQWVFLKQDRVLDLSGLRSTKEGQDSEPNGADSPEEAGDPGTIVVQSVPPSTVYLDGRLIGETPLTKTDIPSGQHTLYLLRPPNPYKRMVIEVWAGKTTSIRYVFPEHAEKAPEPAQSSKQAPDAAVPQAPDAGEI